jgi:hypothetical protein
MLLLLSMLTFAGATEDADAAFAASDWKAASKAYTRVVKADPTDARAWFRLSGAQHQLGRYDAAVESAKKALSNGFPVVWLLEYNLACAAARAGRSNEAIAALGRAVGAGFSNVDQLASDPDLATLRSSPDWPAIVDQAKRNMEPCKHDPRFSQFDFFLGDWELHTPAGLAGTNHIEKVQRGCAIQESWSSATGRTGTSLSTLDPVTGRWSQLWMSDAGWRIFMEGGLDSRGAMVMSGPDSQLPKTASLARTTWSPKDPDSISYVMEASKDGGQTWELTFEGFYRRTSGE